MRCPTCQHDNPDGTPFCGECGTRLSPTGSVAAGQMTVDHLISHVSPAHDAADLFRQMNLSHQGWLGVIFRW